MATAYQPVPTVMGDITAWCTLLARAINNVLAGKLNATGTITLTPNATTTTLTDSRIGATSWIGLSPTTANAAAESPWVSTQITGSAVINHANTATVDRTFTVLIIG